MRAGLRIEQVAAVDQVGESSNGVAAQLAQRPSFGHVPPHPRRRAPRLRYRIYPPAPYCFANSIMAFTLSGRAPCIGAPVEKMNPPPGAAFIERSLALATGLVPRIGYDRAAAVARNAYESGRTIRQVLTAEGILPKEEIDPLLDI